MATADEHLRQDVGSLLAQLLLQIALLKAEVDRLQAAVVSTRAVPGDHREVPTR
jgi:hypothetical protein